MVLKALDLTESICFWRNQIGGHLAYYTAVERKNQHKHNSHIVVVPYAVFLPYIHISRMRKRMSLHNIRDVYVYIYISKNCYAVDVFLLMPFVDCVCVYFGVTRTYFHVLYSHFVSFSHPHTKHAVITYTFHKFMYIQCQIIKLLHRFAYVLGIRKKKKKERRIFYSENRWRVKRHAKQM